LSEKYHFKAKSARGMTQVVDHLSDHLEVLSSGWGGGRGEERKDREKERD
jgi:hypothetical protein